jgi:uncharacterized membrane protein
MKTSLVKCVEAAALAGALALAAATSSFAQTRTAADGTRKLSQYCVPPDDSLTAHRIFCRAEPG